MLTHCSIRGELARLGGRAAILCPAGLWAFLGAVLVSSVTTGAEKPNILFLLSDDHSYPFVGCYGDSNVRTPTLDRLAAEGIKFHRFFTTAPQCVPSRVGLLTGRSPVAARFARRHLVTRKVSNRTQWTASLGPPAATRLNPRSFWFSPIADWNKFRYLPSEEGPT